MSEKPVVDRKAVADFAHQVNNRLTVITGSAGLLLWRSLDADTKERLQAIEDAAQEVAKLTEDFRRACTAAMPSPVVEEAGVEWDALPRGTESILLVDDEGSVQSAIGGVLASLGYIVFGAESGVVALETFVRMRSEGNPVNLVITDLAMDPGMSGITLRNCIRDIKPDLPVILLTGQAEDVAGEVGFAKVIGKPVRVAHLALAVRAVLDAAAQAGK